MERLNQSAYQKKLKIYISNLPNEQYNEWRDELTNWLILSEKAYGIYCDYSQYKRECPICNLYNKVFPEKEVPLKFTKINYQELADRMICIYFNYDYSDMPLGGWETNCFDGRLCEEDYAEKIIDFINFISYHDKNVNFLTPCPQWIYSSNYDEINHYRIFWGGEQADEYIKTLIEFGRVLDNFLCDKNDYLLFDYLANSIHEDKKFNEYHLLKTYSLCQLFLEKSKESELDYKLPELMDSTIPYEKRKEQAELLRKLRNKIAHGDFCSFEKLVEEYAQKIMDGHYNYDYSEYSRKNWVILGICCLLDEILQKLCYLLLYDKSTLEKIKNKTQ